MNSTQKAGHHCRVSQCLLGCSHFLVKCRRDATEQMSAVLTKPSTPPKTLVFVSGSSGQLSDRRKKPLDVFVASDVHHLRGLGRELPS